jgi:hypothetical protein
MKYSTAMGSFVAAALLAGSAFAAEELKSGPQVGKSIPGVFNPLHANGPDAGQKLCLV